MTPNITDITQPARVALRSGCEGVAAINTIMSVMEINLDTLHPEPCVEGYSTPSGYSARAVHPIALGKVMDIAKMMKTKFDLNNYLLSGIGGVVTGGDAAEFILLRANIVQIYYQCHPPISQYSWSLWICHQTLHGLLEKMPFHLNLPRNKCWQHESILSSTSSH
ncbi:hypothetical protein K1719_034107 [Acacia pycnantha]|nr:hypothetical protein K1719_034107 [Acacia pycnantha]